MKYLLVLIVVGVFFLYWKKQRSRVSPPPAGPSSRLQPPQPMVRCTHCGVLLPAKDSVVNAQQQPFCSEAHKQLG